MVSARDTFKPSLVIAIGPISFIESVRLGDGGYRHSAAVLKMLVVYKAGYSVDGNCYWYNGSVHTKKIYSA